MKKPFDLLREVSRFGVSQGLSLNDPGMPSAFGLHVDDSMKRALSDPILLQGLRAEAMFENLVTSLGEVVMIKSEDTGPLQTALPMQAPDFRIVLKDGSNWLVEVKNVYVKNAFRQRRRILTRDYRRALTNYAQATGGTLKLAVFWARWAIWTLVDPEQLAPGDQELTLDMMTAVKVNELAAIGDQTRASAGAVLDVTRHTASNYAELKANLAKTYLAKWMRKDRPRWVENWVDKATGQHLQVDENDLWICAQAREHDLILVTADHGIRRIAQADPAVQLLLI